MDKISPEDLNFSPMPELTTKRMKMRGWRASDVAVWADMSADTEIMHYFPKTLSFEEVVAQVDDFQGRFRKWGISYWALETPEIPFAGIAGLSRPQIEAHFIPCVEIGWRVVRQAWGQGLATEAARQALKFGFAEKNFEEIVAMVSAENLPSRKVAEKLGMTCDPADDFEYPKVEWPYRSTVLYRISREAYLAQ